MSRGHYGPVDRQTNYGFVVGFAEDEAKGYLRDRTIGRAARAALPFARGYYGAKRAYVGAQMLGNRVDASKPLAQVGSEWFHSVADRARAVARLDADFKALSDDLATWQTANVSAPTATTTAQWLAADVTPTLTEWNQFAARESSSWFARAATSWEVFEDWQARLRRLRELARAHGVSLQSAEPVDLPKTIWQHGASGTGGELASWMGVLKIAIGAALAITGVVTLYSVVREISSRRSAAS